MGPPCVNEVVSEECGDDCDGLRGLGWVWAGAGAGDGDGQVSDAGTDARAVALVGGGATGGPVSGVVEVFVQNWRGSAIRGAIVEAADGPSSVRGMTDARGYVRLQDVGLSGAVNVSAVAGGMQSETWIGVAGRVVTMRLHGRLREEPIAVLASGGILGWDDLPAPQAGWRYGAIVTHTRDFYQDVGQAFVPDLRPVAGYGNVRENECVRTATVSDCNWRLVAPSGDHTLVATIFRVGTLDGSVTPIGYAARSGCRFVTSITRGSCWSRCRKQGWRPFA